MGENQVTTTRHSEYFTEDHTGYGRWYIPLTEWERTLGLERQDRGAVGPPVPAGIFLKGDASEVEHETAIKTVKARTAEYRSKCSDYADWQKAQALFKQARDERKNARD